ncbi:hypothetical protein [Parachitinimonas caeni]|uniref:Uncharacterized protein n=1 Tax=Parachitinimonas caeni TaxID=3031301 RepID=A0ABT7DWN1_9NEIS|nr:hypothetical protein [Parachitinimonas caeni]MDK2124473.1 hypothetical protein [Parachitinimonas caeni]
MSTLQDKLGHALAHGLTAHAVLVERDSEGRLIATVRYSGIGGDAGRFQVVGDQLQPLAASEVQPC